MLYVRKLRLRWPISPHTRLLTARAKPTPLGRISGWKQSFPYSGDIAGNRKYMDADTYSRYANCALCIVPTYDLILGSNKIRTYVDSRQWIYNPPPLATRASTHLKINPILFFAVSFSGSPKYLEIAQNWRCIATTIDVPASVYRYSWVSKLRTLHYKSINVNPV